jgi:hypothetical protein
MPAALDGAIPSLQARHKKQRLLFFAERLIQLYRWHCHKAARAEADLSVLSIPPRIGSGGSVTAKIGFSVDLDLHKKYVASDLDGAKTMKNRIYVCVSIHFLFVFHSELICCPFQNTVSDITW